MTPTQPTPVAERPSPGRPLLPHWTGDEQAPLCCGASSALHSSFARFGRRGRAGGGRSRRHANPSAVTALLAALCGCASATTPPADVPVDAPADAPAAPVDAADAADAADAERPACDPQRHIDCFGGAACVAGMATRLAYAPYPCCNAARCQQALADNICAVQRLACPSGACDDGRSRCNGDNLRAMTRTSPGFDLGVLCAGGGRREGDPCRRDADCAPQAEGSSGRLRCMPGKDVCVRGPRPATAVGATCVWDDDCAEGDRCDCGGATGRARVCVSPLGGDAGAGDAGDAAGDG